MDLNNGMDITSTPLLTIPEFSDDLSQSDSFDNGFDIGSFNYNDSDNIFGNTLKE